MANYIDYIQKMSCTLKRNDMLGDDHKYVKMLESIIDESIIDTSDHCSSSSSSNNKARDAFETICQDPEVHKLYFPINIDFEKQTAWLRHVLCGQFLCAPHGRLHAVLIQSHRGAN
jgi:hypothetical protein